jgi:TonB family protein
LAETGMAGYSRLEAATKTSSLLYASKPWHLKLDVQLYDKKGLLSQQGSIERWQSEDDSRTVSSFGASTGTVVVHNDHNYRQRQGEAVPREAEILLRSVLHPGPYPQELAGTEADLRPTLFGKQQADCIMLSRTLNRLKTTPLGLFPTYCITAGDHLSVIYNFGSDLVVRNQVGTFLGLDVTMSAVVLEGQRVVARAKVTELSTFTPKPDEFEPGTELAASSAFARVSGEVQQGQRISALQPVYPQAAKRDHIEGRVILQAVIGTDGHVHSLVPVSGPDPDLVLSAMAAVKDWTYKPYLLNGVPTDVMTTITVNYNLR